MFLLSIFPFSVSPLLLPLTFITSVRITAVVPGNCHRSLSTASLFLQCKWIMWILCLIPFSVSPFFIGCSLKLLASSTRFSAIWYLLITQSLFSQHSHFIPLPDFRLLSHPKTIAVSSLFSPALHLNIFLPVSLWLKLSTHWVPISTLIVFCKLVITSLSSWSIFSLVIPGLQ